MLPQKKLPNQELLHKYTLEEESRESKAKNNGSNYYSLSLLQLLTQHIADLEYLRSIENRSKKSTQKNSKNFLFNSIKNFLKKI